MDGVAEMAVLASDNTLAEAKASNSFPFRPRKALLVMTGVALS